jgi:hypothetical protein
MGALYQYVIIDVGRIVVRHVFVLSRFSGSMIFFGGMKCVAAVSGELTCLF